MTLVLLVEDDTNLLRALETVVIGAHRGGWRGCNADDCAERPDVVVSDVMMPRMDGAKLVRCLKGV